MTTLQPRPLVGEREASGGRRSGRDGRRWVLTGLLKAGLALGTAEARASTLVSQSRTIDANASVTVGAQTISDPRSASTTDPGQFTDEVQPFVRIEQTTASSDAYQSSFLSGEDINITATAFTGVSIQPGASASSDATSRCVVTFTVSVTENWRLDTTATISGALAGSRAVVRLQRAGATLFEADTDEATFPIHRTYALAPGTYQFEALADSLFDGPPGSGITNSSATLSVMFGSGAPAPPQCDGDANGDGMVDFTDLNIVLSQYAMTGSLPGDLDGDGDVDFNDLNTVLVAFGTMC